MQIRYHCPNDHCVAIVEYEPLESCGESMECPRCHRSNTITLTDSIRDRHMVDRCVVCGCPQLFVKKDFPARLGLLIVVIFGMASLYYFRSDVLIAWAILASAVLLDLLIYLFLGRVTICYGCRAEYRRYVENPAHTDFKLTTSEKY